MIDAPFSAATAAAVLIPLAATFIAIGGLLMIFAASRRAAVRALVLGALVAMFAALAGQVFR